MLGSFFYHAFTLFIIFLFAGSILIGLYFGFIIAEKHIARNLEKNKSNQGESTDVTG
jgi:uncharacterized protein YneF (UPF0154 family)